MYVGLIQALNPVIKKYDQRIRRVFDAHPEVKISRLTRRGPRAGTSTLGLLWHRPLSLCGGPQRAELHRRAPVTKSSGKSRVVYARAACPKFDRQTFHEFSRLSVTHCQWARNDGQSYTDKGKK